MGLAEWDLFYWGGTDQRIKSDHHPFFIPNIPLFHHSIIPLGVKGKRHPSGVKSVPGPLGPDLYDHLPLKRAVDNRPGCYLAFFSASFRSAII